MTESAQLVDEAYYELRAEVELKRAQEATDVSVVSAHYRMATLDLDQISARPEERPALIRLTSR